ncbi:hypothetical protein C2W62_26300 [Candidatus Entotheonella serta]|nr:hypothetical protein C2W62_26300 [Candidatus Entotheonella serta]
MFEANEVASLIQEFRLFFHRVPHKLKGEVKRALKSYVNWELIRKVLSKICVYSDRCSIAIVGLASVDGEKYNHSYGLEVDVRIQNVVSF